MSYDNSPGWSPCHSPGTWSVGSGSPQHYSPCHSPRQLTPRTIKRRDAAEQAINKK